MGLLQVLFFYGSNEGQLRLWGKHDTYQSAVAHSLLDYTKMLVGWICNETKVIKESMKIHIGEALMNAVCGSRNCLKWSYTFLGK